MRNVSRHASVAAVLMLGLFTSSCLVKRERVIKRNGVAASQSKPLFASEEQLNQRIANTYDAIQSFQATMELSASVGSVYKEKITDYQDVHAFALFRKLADIRLIGKLPVVGTTAFDMVSNGATFRVSLPTKNRFVIGENSAPSTSTNPLENLRPYALLSSMIIKPMDPANEFMLLEDETDENESRYELHFVSRGTDGKKARPTRAVWFNRLDLSIVEQREFDDDALISSDTKYRNWTNYNGILFPNTIEIRRPKDGYGVTMTIEKMEMNLSLSDDKFILNQPPDAQVLVLGAKARTF